MYVPSYKVAFTGYSILHLFTFLLKWKHDLKLHWEFLNPKNVFEKSLKFAKHFAKDNFVAIK